MPTPGTNSADISVIICTRNRAESLRQTLDCLARADREGLRCEVIVVDNGGNDATREVAASFAAHFPVHVLREETPGKAFALNRALDDAPLGNIIAVLDDDMSPHPDWFKGLKAICDRWPDHDWFTGKSYVIWPNVDIPAWCHRPYFQGWAFSVMDGGPRDREAAAGRWFSGNHFWFRRRALATRCRFDVGLDLRTHLDVSQAQFMLELAEHGLRGIIAPDAVCGHRVQPELLRAETIQRRATQVGLGFAWVRLRPYKTKVKQARLFCKHPVLSRLYCAAAVIGWSAARVFAVLLPDRAVRFERCCLAIERRATYREYLRLAGTLDEYRLWNRQG